MTPVPDTRGVIARPGLLDAVVHALRTDAMSVALTGLERFGRVRQDHSGRVGVPGQTGACLLSRRCAVEDRRPAGRRSRHRDSDQWIAAVVPPEAACVRVGALTGEQAEAVLSRELEVDRAALAGLATRTGGWPVLCSLVNGTLRRRVARGGGIADGIRWAEAMLDRNGPAALDTTDSAARDLAIETTMAASLTMMAATDPATVDRYCKLGDLQRLRRPPSRVVLSACELGLSSVRAGDEILGMVAALLAAGSSTVIASVASPVDETVPDVMVPFHRLLAGGRDPAEALASATADHPESSFVCFGSS